MGGASRAKSNWFKHKNPKNRNSKLVLKFDEEDRNDFLTGFQRRKKERREHAQKIALERQKEEKLQARKERRDAKKELLSNTELYFPKDFESELKQKSKAEVFDHAHHTVTVTTVTKVDLSEHGGLGANKFEYEDEENVEDSEEGSNSEEEEKINIKKTKKTLSNKSKWHSSDITRQKFWMKLKARKQKLKKLSKCDPQAFSKSKQQQRRLLKKHGRRK
ncbi:nucleolar protein 12-like [Anneissia japonica]|uniref:nucleolar protein 12-like n=1 Tax=Anneissia japonica TaxID=1529436 RepID=UPI0014257D41|nr:nucleolar protein 12-like [Anneissia japonica]